MDLIISFATALVALLICLQVTVLLLWIERKGSALIQDRVGANRANLFGGLLPFNLGIVNTMMADPLKLLTKEDIVPAAADRFLHWLAPWVAVSPLFLTFAVVPFGYPARAVGARSTCRPSTSGGIPRAGAGIARRVR
jgi:NADH-quinone oxidoreductase subunit H